MYWLRTEDGESSWSSKSGEFESEEERVAEPGWTLILRRCCKLMVVSTRTRSTIGDEKEEW